MKKDFEVLIEISKDDLKASLLLYERKMYPQSLFYFQQSIEKLIKFIGLDNEIIDKNDLIKKISHNSNLIFKKAIEKLQYQVSSEVNFDIDEEFQNIRNYIGNYPIEPVIEVLINQIKETLKDKPQLPFNIDEIKTAEDLYNVLKQINPNNPDLEAFLNLKDKPHFKEFMDKRVKDFSFYLPHYIQAILILFYINVLSEQLVTSVRYPQIEDMINPRDKYTEKHSIVKHLPTFQAYLEYCLKIIAESKK